MGTSLAWITDSVANASPTVSPELPALALDDGPTISYGQLRERELRYAAALQNAGVDRGDRVALLMHNSVDYIALLLAVARTGAISVRPNWRLTAPELAYIVGDSEPKVLIFDTHLAPVVADIRDSVGLEQAIAFGDGDTPPWASAFTSFVDSVVAPRIESFPSLSMDDPYSLMYTSGTTGKPKGALLTHGNAIWIGTIQSLKWRLDSTAVSLNAGPLFHAGAFEVLLLPTLLSHGTAVTLSSGGFTLDRYLRVAQHHQVTTMMAYSFAVYELVQRDDLAERVPNSLRRILTGGDTIMPWVYDELEKRLPGVELVQSYSLTEGGVVGTMLDHGDARGRERSVGRPNPMTEVKVVDESGHSADTGVVGEVWLRSPGVSVGYWRKPTETKATFIDGWCRTGDLGSIDADGYLTLVGRAKDMIRSGGENIYPAEVEKLLTDHGSVAAAAVVGVPDPKYVEVGCAVMEPHAGQTIDIDEIRAYLIGKLASFKIPKHYVVVDQLPRNASGKIQKNVLRADYASVG